MGTLSLLLPLSLSFPRSPNHPSSRTYLPKPVSCPNISSNSLNPARIRVKTVVFRRNSSTEPDESQFLDENGVVDDMDGYLNYLSLEYDSVWDTKPSWCQPWTITLTGVLAIACSWLIHCSFSNYAAGVLECISYNSRDANDYGTEGILERSANHALLHIGLAQKEKITHYQAYEDMIAERRKRVTSGVEDTYGVRNIQ